MSISSAIRIIKMGGKAKRENWSNHNFIEFDERTGTIMYHNGTNHLSYFVPCQVDILTNDWEIID